MRAASTRSAELFARAQRFLAGGVDSPVRAGAPMGAPPPVISRARGARVTDVDGDEYIDYVCAYGPVLLGHADQSVTAAVESALRAGTVFGATHPEEVRLAERICALMPSIERLRFVNTGTEACMSAVRVARAFTGRERIVRLRGCYHGHSDEMIFSAGASSASVPTIQCGVPHGAVAGVTIVEYNDARALERALSDRSAAAVIIEPVAANMGLVLPEPGYLQAVRAACDRTGTLLIFDEVITGFRFGTGGAQARCGVDADITCVGKTLGGGLPIAAFGGRADIMEVLAPAGGVFQGGTFSGNPVCVAAAHAFLDELHRDSGFYDRLDSLGRRLAEGARRAIEAAGLDYPVVQLGSIVDFAFRSGAPPRNCAEASQADGDAYARYYWRMLERGIMLPPSNMEVMFLTAAHTEEDIARTVLAIGEALAG
ncbi:MAG TPA: glutamate-1-semialdehyde 2,1-aminomutase [Candidatus Binatus sp.]|nr:glutamate-1-semialdehyde 2,1-aminomutase [Candidatus Binatus sp.]